MEGLPLRAYLHLHTAACLLKGKPPPFSKGELSLTCLNSECRLLSPQKLCTYNYSLPYIISFLLSIGLFSSACTHALVPFKTSKALCPPDFPNASHHSYSQQNSLKEVPGTTVSTLFINIDWHFAVLAANFTTFFSDLVQNKCQTLYIFAHKYFNMYLSDKVISTILSTIKIKKKEY